VRSIWDNTPKRKFGYPIFGRITCAHETSETTFRKKRGGHLFGGWALLWTHQEYCAPKPMAGGEGVAAPSPRTRTPLMAHLASDLWINPCCIKKLAFLVAIASSCNKAVN